jgi:1-aminocyclopropane-1-carboxylate deaminase/D-cysteine desulfhydrase-like pyridoxal-dependent ACC family enzyme
VIYSEAIARFRQIPRLHLGMYPTPIEEMPRLRSALGGGPRLYIKHDDYAGPGFGGNKVRKLEYVFAEAQRTGVDTVLTIGNIRSNHARVTAAISARLGIRCHLILNGRAKDVPASRYLDELYGAVIHPVNLPQERGPAMERIAADLHAAGAKVMEIPLGASDALGSLGCVRVAEEIAESGLRFDAIFHSSSSGGTQAGLDAGLQLFGLGDAGLIGVSPDDAAASISAHVAQIRDAIAARLSLEPELRRAVSVDDRFVGEGYGIPSPEGNEATRLLARTEGVVLDPAYTAKAMASLVAHIRAGEFSEAQSVLFIHTGGQLALFSARPEILSEPS